MPDVVRMGVVGAGNVSQRGILPHLSQGDVQDRVHLAAVVDLAPGRAEAAAAKYNVDRAFTDFDDMLANGNIDAVTLASPIGLHFEQGRAALQAGKHVHFNKTMTTTAAEATELIELAGSKGLKIVASPGEMNRPHNQEIKKLLASGAIGTPTWAICGAAFGRYHEEEEFRGGTDVLTNIDPSWYFRKPGGGPMYDMTVYALHGLTGILGPAKRVTAMSGTRIKEREFGDKKVPTDADDNTIVLLDFGDNMYAVAYGTAAGGVTRGFGATYFGTAGSIVGQDLNGTPIEWPGRDLGPQNALPHVVGEHRNIGEAHVYEDIMQLVDWIREGTPSLATAEHARHVIEIIESGYRASETGQAQDLKTTF